MLILTFDQGQVQPHVTQTPGHCSCNSLSLTCLNSLWILSTTFNFKEFAAWVRPKLYRDTFFSLPLMTAVFLSGVPILPPVFIPGWGETLFFHIGSQSQWWTRHWQKLRGQSSDVRKDWGILVLNEQARVNNETRWQSLLCHWLCFHPAVRRLYLFIYFPSISWNE